MVIDTALLSRIQFGFTISFHILFPAFSIGLAMFLAIMEGAWIKTKKPLYLNICKFWTKVFALTFGMGVVSGLVMEFQLGTNWAGFTRAIGGVLGPLFTYEVMTAFFIEAGFLGVMLFGWDRVSHKLHYLATLLVLIGTTLSAYWIMSANTWMQHPVGFTEINGVYNVSNWKEVVFNAATFPRFIHMMLASYISAGFVIASVSALYLLNKKFTAFAKKCFSFIWYALIILIPLQIFFGDMTGVLVQKIQPLKTAAMEGLWETQRGAPLLLFAIPDQKNQTNYLEISIPHLAAVLNTHEWNGELIGLKSVTPENQPNVITVFFTFRIMVGVGLLMLLLAAIALYLRIKQRLYDTPWFLKACIFSAPLGFIALWCGWITTEIGRQPWVVYNLIRTSDAVSHVALRDVMISFGLIFIVYGIIFGYFYFYFLHKTLSKGPSDHAASDEPHQPFQYMPKLGD
ncbi:MAG: cytochrome ubiquinol oxidase subunit I [Gammaproteobacteria bacterium]